REPTGARLQISLEIVELELHPARRVVVLVEPSAQPERPIPDVSEGRVFPIDKLFVHISEGMVAVASVHRNFGGAAKLVVHVFEAMIAAVPSAQRLAGDIVQHPALTRIYAVLVEL